VGGCLGLPCFHNNGTRFSYSSSAGKGAVQLRLWANEDDVIVNREDCLFPTPRPTTATLTPGQLTAQSSRGAQVADPRWDADVNNNVRRLAFYAALGLIFLRYSLFHEVLTSVIGNNTYILYLFAIPAALGVVSSGGIRRTLAARQTKYWLAFVAWLLLSVPFSSWKGESATYALSYLRTDVPMLFYTAGLALTWKECRQMLATIGIAGISTIGVALLIGRDFGNGRMGLNFGVVSNPNDYAGHLLLILPWILFLVIFPPRLTLLRWLIRLVGVAATLAGLWLILMTGSRGALVALIIGSVYVLWESSTKVRIAAILGLPLLAVLLLTVVSGPVRTRLISLTSDNEAPKEARESSETRRFLLEESIRLSLRRPLFGVGAGQFQNYEGKVAGWHGTHNSFTQISSECGIPALVFYLGALFSTFLLLGRTWRQVRERPELREISIACYCMAMSYAVFCAVIFFLNFGYFFYLPAATGLVIAISRSAQRELSALKLQKQSIPGPSRPVQLSPLQPASAAPVHSPRPRAVRFNRFR
jgi:O-antigen ligase